MSTLLVDIFALKLVPLFSTPASSVVVPASKILTSVLDFKPVKVRVFWINTVVVDPVPFLTVGCAPSITLIETEEPESL